MQTFEQVWAIASKIDAQITKEEAKELWRIAKSASGDAIEVGCGVGQVSVLLAGCGPVICVDEFTDQDHYTNWRKNIMDSGLAGNIEVVKEKDGYNQWESQIGLLVINSSALDAISQISGWDAHLLRGAALCMSGKIAPPKNFRIEKAIGSLATYRKI